MRVALVVMYFGKLPEYFQLFLKSCEKNEKFTWIIFTDDMTDYKYPKNVKRINMKFDRCREIFQEKFDFKISLDNPQKLCDFKCAYGYLLKEYLTEFDYWGHCDLDQIFGNLSNFITDDILNRYDKLYTLGHLTIYRNDKDVNRQFMNKYNGRYRYKEVFKSSKCHGFDEWIDININNIFFDSGYKFLDTAIGADIDPYSTTFKLAWYDKKLQVYIRDNIASSIFEWDNGSIYRYYESCGEILKDEFPYIHLQKRKMKLCNECINSNKFFIVPNKFIPNNYDVISLIKKHNIYKVLNYQYFRVKYKSLKQRLKTKNFEFNNVFR